MNYKKSTILTLLTILITVASFGQDKIFTEYDVKKFSFKGHKAKIVFQTIKMKIIIGFGEQDFGDINHRLTRLC
ncbi:hypothetical protein MKD41_00625 [Lutibacter sp. A64]|uniref:hypothetical protein n=1 Tax=Lutibacter sp. A64 TaxID=2918526 RepID=UPI001F053CAB|nr:hypothetical protein [Lutibacter sp. A64]UMB54002.1 hypothetical protein MKD41_00625 [Lutibacter sp. A64]